MDFFRIGVGVGVRKRSKVRGYGLLLAGLAMLGGLVLMLGRGKDEGVEVRFSSMVYARVDGSAGEDGAVSIFLEGFSGELRELMGRRLTTSRGVMALGQPESVLGNLVTDMVRSLLPEKTGMEADVVILNRGGLRIPLPEGEVTVGTMFELLPFENYVVLLRFAGVELLRIADEIAVEGGEPVSGLTLVISDGGAREVLVGGERVDGERLYWVATNNWLADGGGPMPTLWEPRERIDTEVLIRDIFIEYLSARDVIEPLLDGRIRGGGS